MNRGRGILGSPKPLGGTEPGQHRPSRPALPPPGDKVLPPSLSLAGSAPANARHKARLQRLDFPLPC